MQADKISPITKAGGQKLVVLDDRNGIMSYKTAFLYFIKHNVYPESKGDVDNPTKDDIDCLLQLVEGSGRVG